MEFIELRAENFCSIGSIALNLNSPGLILVTGVNKDAPKANSNGSGKSLLFDALCWCLWGETVRQLSGDDVVNLRTGKDCAVSVTLEDNGDTYVISRHRKDTRTPKPNDLLVFQNGVPLTAKGKIKSMQEVVDRIVGFDFVTFCAMMPGAAIKAAHMTDSEIKSLLERLLQTEQLAHAYESSRVRLRELDSRLVLLQTQLADVSSNVTREDRELQQLQQMAQSFEQNKQTEIAELEASCTNLRIEIDKLEQEDKSLVQLNTELALVNEEVQELHKELQTNEQKRKAWVQAAQGQHLNFKATVRNLASQRDSQADEIVKLLAIGPVCGECKQAVDASHLSSISAELNEKLGTTQQKLADAEQAEAAWVVRCSAEDARFAAVSKNYRDTISMKTAAANMLNSRIQQIVSGQRLLSKLREDLQGKEQQLASACNKESGFEQLMQEKALYFKELNQKKLELEENVCPLETEKKLCQFWVDGFSAQGLRSFMLEYVTPILNDRAAYYSKLLTDDEMKVVFSTKSKLKNGQVKEKFQIQVSQKHGGNLYKATSAGERSRADLVISMALGDLASLRAGKQLPWRFLDEPFESIDEAGTDAIVRLLNDQRARYKTVFVVTHRSSFKQMFTQTVTVVKENAISRLSNEKD
ncbi:AAA family ATPase [bacterium]|nr:AAA family ATPase [bacterium]